MHTQKACTPHHTTTQSFLPAFAWSDEITGFRHVRWLSAQRSLSPSLMLLFNPLKAHVGKRELTFTSCLLSPIWTPWHRHGHVTLYTLNFWNTNKKFKVLFIVFRSLFSHLWHWTLSRTVVMLGVDVNDVVKIPDRNLRTIIIVSSTIAQM